MANQIRRGGAFFLAELARHPLFYLPIGIALLILFTPTTTILVVARILQIRDPFPGSEILLPYVIGLSVLATLLGLAITLGSVRAIAFPGTFWYRLTHLGRHQR